MSQIVTVRSQTYEEIWLAGPTYTHNTQTHTHKRSFTLLGGAGSFLNHMFSDAYIQSVPRDAQVPANTIEIRVFQV